LPHESKCGADAHSLFPRGTHYPSDSRGGRAAQKGIFDPSLFLAGSGDLAKKFEKVRHGMNVLIIDGQGGQLGCSLIKAINERIDGADITAVGTNVNATAAMMKAGAKKGATGENPVVVASKKADVIIGPIGIVISDSMLGEITPKMAAAVGSSDAVRILIPVNKCENIVAGVPSVSVSVLIEDAVRRLSELK